MTDHRQNRTDTAPAPAGAFALSSPGAVLRALCCRPPVWAGLAACLLAGYGPALFGGAAVGIDDLAIDIYQQGGEFLRQSRVTEWLVQAATGLLTCRPFWPEFMAGICLALAGVGLTALLYAAAGRQPNTAGALLLAGGLLLFPFHAEAFAYTNLCLTGLGILLCVGALALCRTHLLGGWRRGLPGAAGAAVLLAFALGCYESMAQVWLVLLFAFLLTDAQARPARSRPAWRSVPAVLRGLWPFAAGLLLRNTLAAALRLALGITGENGSAATTIYWFRRESLREAVKIFVHQSITRYIGLAYAVPAQTLLLAACLLFVLWVPLRWHGNGSGMLALGLLVSVFAMGILQGTGSQIARICQCYAVFVPFVAWLCLRGALDDAKWRRALALTLTAALLAAEAVSLGRTFAADRTRWQYEQTLLRGIGTQLDELDPAGTQPVVFTGYLALPDEASFPLPPENRAYAVEQWMKAKWDIPTGILYRYEEVNESVINWSLGAFGSHEQLYRLMDYIGRPCLVPAPEQQAAGEALAADIEPGGTVTAQDGYLLVRF